MSKKVLMLAAEHGRFKGAKVGGVGDVIRDVPKALIEEGCRVSVAMPSYGFLARIAGLKKVSDVDVHFNNQQQSVEIFLHKRAEKEEPVYIFHHPLFSPQGESVYCDDPDHRPFATDATKFAFFCASVAAALCYQVIELPDTVHCHDWHTGFFALLARRHEQYKNIKNIRIVYTIHNLAMQGVRPISGDSSALLTWFSAGLSDLTDVKDPEYTLCINPMRAGINLSDMVHTVSPTYAKEILKPSDHAKGIFGGERLEADLKKRAAQGKLIGILNGCDYTEKKVRKPAKAKLINMALIAQERWVGQTEFIKSAHFLAQKRMHYWLNNKSAKMTITSVGRITEQKVRVLFTPVDGAKSVLDVLLESLTGTGFFVLLGSGSKHYEQALTQLMGKYNNFVFLNGYDEELSKQLYAYGDLFLMPSSFEPCGISQLLAMRAGQPCLVSNVGGLRDTVDDGETGFVFEGESDAQKAKNLLLRLEQAVTMFESRRDEYKNILSKAKAARFDWASVARDYISKLYTNL